MHLWATRRSRTSSNYGPSSPVVARSDFFFRFLVLDPFVVERTLSVSGSRDSTGVWRTLLHLASDDLTRWRLTRVLRRRFASGETDGAKLDKATLDRVVALAGREISLAQQLRMLDATQRVFGYWHVAHRPFAVTALVAVVVHVAVVIAVGATWFW